MVNTVRGKCPCCGAEIDADLIVVDLNTNRIGYKGRVVSLAPRVAEVAYLLLKDRPKTVSLRSLIRGTYGLKEPSNGEKLVTEYVGSLRRNIRPIGLDVIAVKGHGFSLAEMSHEETYA